MTEVKDDPEAPQMREQPREEDEKKQQAKVAAAPEETQRESEDDHDIVSGNNKKGEVCDDEEEAILVREVMEELEQERRRGRRRNMLFVLLFSIVIAVIVVLIVTLDGNEDSSDDQESLAGQHPLPESPCVGGDYEGRTVTITPEVAAREFCGRTLLPNTAYMVDDDVTCLDSDGPRLSTRTCLDCGGHTILGATSERSDALSLYDGVRIENTAGAVTYNCVVKNFHLGINMNGASNGTLLNVETVHNHHGVYEHHGFGNEISCSVTKDNEMNGVLSSSSRRTRVKGLVSQGNSAAGVGLINDDQPGSGVRFLNNVRGTLKCSDVNSNDGVGVTLTNSHETEVESTLVTNNTLHNIYLQEHYSIRGEEPSTTALVDVKSCYAAYGSDIYGRDEDFGLHDDAESFRNRQNDLEDEYGEELQYGEGQQYLYQHVSMVLATSNLTCDEVVTDKAHMTEPSCDSECPDSHSSLTLPASCDEICPHGIGKIILPEFFGG